MYISHLHDNHLINFSLLDHIVVRTFQKAREVDYLLSLFFVIQVHLPPLIKSLHLFIFFYVVKNLFMLSKKKKPLTIASLYS